VVRVSRRVCGVALSALLITIAAGASASPSVSGQSLSTAALENGQRARSAYGFDGDHARVRTLAARKSSRASREHGFPMSAREAADLLGRSTFVQRLDNTVLSSARSLDAYAGEWIDQRDDGRLVIGLTRAAPGVKTRLRQSMPAGSRGVRFVEVNDSAAALAVALDRAPPAWDGLGADFQPQAFAIHYRRNRITVKVRRHQLDAARVFKAQLQVRLGVDVGFAASPAVIDLAPKTACSSRERCYGPLRLGTRINFPRSYPDSRISTHCGMGFHLRDPRFGSRHGTFLTAGHCVYGRSGPWHQHDDYKARYGKIGSRVSSRYTSDHRDIALIRLDDWKSNRSTRIFGDGGWSAGARLTRAGRVIEGEILCVSLARSDTNWCGIADATEQWWVSTTANPNIRVRGAAIDFPGAPGRRLSPGDSGSPIYRRSTSSSGSPIRAPIGIVNAGSPDTPKEQEEHTVYFAKVWWALNDDAGWPELQVFTAPPPPLSERAFTATWKGTGPRDHRTRFVAKSVAGASSYHWDFGDGSRGSGRKITHRFGSPGERKVKLTVRFRGDLKRSRSIRITANPARTYAPLVYLHPQETYRPISVGAYLSASRLMFEHDAGCAPSTIESGAVSPWKLGHGGYAGSLANDSDCGAATAEVHSDQNSRPHDPGNELPEGERGEGFYLDLEDRRRSGASHTRAPAYYEYKPGRWVIYWFFSAYDQHDGAHEGDWEHIAVRLDSVGLGTQFAYYRHECAPRVFGRSQMKKGLGQRNTGFSGRTHPIVYSAKGSHASYWKRSGSWSISDSCGLPMPASTDRTAKGKPWRTWRTLKKARTAWYGYGGAWGPPGSAVDGKRINDGPLGPSRYKLPDAVPGSW
jgi:hypothetical protein